MVLDVHMKQIGRGSIQMRSRAVIEERGGGCYAFVVTEIPFQVNKARMIEKIAELVRDNKIDGITDLRDEELYVLVCVSLSCVGMQMQCHFK